MNIKCKEKQNLTIKEYEEAREKYLKKLDIWDSEFNEEYDYDRKQYFDSERC